MKPINCNGCTACCKSDVVELELQNGDDPTLYEHLRMMRTSEGRTIIALGVKPNGDCAYLGATGCAIQPYKPLVCKRFDCREYFQSGGAQWRALKMAEVPALKAVFSAGLSRLLEGGRP